MLDIGRQLSVVERNQRVTDAEICSMEQQLKEIEAKHVSSIRMIVLIMRIL